MLFPVLVESALTFRINALSDVQHAVQSFKKSVCTSKGEVVATDALLPRVYRQHQSATPPRDPIHPTMQ